MSSRWWDVQGHQLGLPPSVMVAAFSIGDSMPAVCRLSTLLTPLRGDKVITGIVDGNARIDKFARGMQIPRCYVAPV